MIKVREKRSDKTVNYPNIELVPLEGHIGGEEYYEILEGEIPEFDYKTHKLIVKEEYTKDMGKIYPLWKQTYSLEELSTEEIKANIIQESEMNKYSDVQKVLAIKAEEIAQDLEGEEALEVQSIFPFWAKDLECIKDHKYQDFNEDNELVLYRCEQGHTTQSNWRPKDMKALFTRVAKAGEVLVWVQPTGSQDAYMKGNKVHYPTLKDPIYESTVDNNTWSPITYGWVKL